NPAWEITSVSDEVIDVFSTPSHDIDAESDGLIADYQTRHGRRPSPRTLARPCAHATLATRPGKTAHPPAGLTATWRARATEALGKNATAWASTLTRNPEPAAVLRADDVPLEAIAELGGEVVAVVGEKRSTWRRFNLHAEA